MVPRAVETNPRERLFVVQFFPSQSGIPRSVEFADPTPLPPNRSDQSVSVISDTQFPFPKRFGVRTLSSLDEQPHSQRM